MGILGLRYEIDFDLVMLGSVEKNLNCNLSRQPFVWGP
jgi:hypothetical protein